MEKIKSWKFYAKLKQKKFREETGLFLVEGVKLSREAVISEWKLEAVFIGEDFRTDFHFEEFCSYFRQRMIQPIFLESKNLKKLSDTENPQGIVLVVKMPESAMQPDLDLESKKFILILENVSDPGNMGTLIRTADWFGIQMIYYSTGSVDPFNPKVVRSAMGSIFRVPLVEVRSLNELIKKLRILKYFMVGTSVKSSASLDTVKFQEPVAVILGSESQGLSPALQNLSDINVCIPGFGGGESLNVSIAGGIIMNSISRQIFHSQESVETNQ